MKIWERQLKREKRKQDRAFFRDMENNIRDSLKHNQLIPGIPSSSTFQKGLLNEIPILEKESIAPSKNRHFVRTISGMDERVLASLNNNNKRQVNQQNTAVVSRHSQVMRSAEHCVNDPPIEQGRPPLHHRRHGALEPDAVSDETRSSPGRSSGENLQEEPRVPPPSGNQSDVPLNAHMRRNTGGTLFVKSTMINPDVQATIKCVCGVYRAHIAQGHELKRNRAPVSPNTVHVDLDIFRDDYELPRRQWNTIPVPSIDEISTFYFEYFERSQMEHDTIIMSLIYVERLIKETNGAVTPMAENWRSLLFSSMILASKVWDDLSMWNIDFSNVSVATGIAPFSLQRINDLELGMLTILRFDVRVPASEYAKYYFLIRNVLIRSGELENAAAPLSKEEAKLFERRTSRYQNAWLSNKSPRVARRSYSFDWDWFSHSTSSEIRHGPVLKDTVCLEQLVSTERHF